MMIPNDLPDYHGYLLRFWREQSTERADAWRFSLEDPQNGKRRSFDSLAELVKFLEEEVRPRSKAEARERADSNHP